MNNQEKLSILEILKSYKRTIQAGHNPENVSITTLDSLIQQVNRNLNYFYITSIHRDDLVGNGLLGNMAENAVMERLASKMSDDYCTQLFHDSCEIIGEHLGIERWEIVRDKKVDIAKDLLTDIELNTIEHQSLLNAIDVLNKLNDNDGDNYNIDNLDERQISVVSTVLENINNCLSKLNDPYWLEKGTITSHGFIEFLKIRNGILLE